VDDEENSLGTRCAAVRGPHVADMVKEAGRRISHQAVIAVRIQEVMGSEVRQRELLVI
jgi:hypothetical protein